MKVVAPRGRPLRRIAAWDDALRDEYTRMCADRAHELARGASLASLERLQAVCDGFGPVDVQAFLTAASV